MTVILDLGSSPNFTTRRAKIKNLYWKG